MPYDEDGNWVDPEEEDSSPGEINPGESQPSSNIEEYLRRARAQAAMAGSTTQEETPYPGQAPTPEMYKPGPKMEAYKAGISATPLKQDYHPSVFRKALGGIGGLATGLSSGGAAGAAAHQALEDAPYNKKYSEAQQKLGVQGQEAQLEAGGNAAAQKYYLDLAKVQHENAQGSAEVERRKAEAARGRRYDWQTSPQHHVEELENIGARGVKAGVVGQPWKVVTVDGKTHTGTVAPGGAFKVGDTIIPPDQIDAEKTTKLGGAPVKISNPFELWHQQNPDAKAEDYLKLHPEKQSEYEDYKISYLKDHPTANSREILRAFSADKEQPQKPPQSLMIDPATNKAVLVRPGSQVPEGARTATQEGTMNMPTSATRGRAQQADVVIETGKDLKNFIQANKAKLGNVDNYWKNFVNGTPMSDPLISEFQTKLASYAALQAAAHGFRGSNVMTDFEHKIGGAQKNPDALIGAINGIESTMQELKKSGGANFGSSGPAGALPGGVTLDEVNAELARRKNGRPQSAK